VTAQTITPDVTPDWSRGVLESFYRVVFSRPDTEIAGLLVGRTGAAGSAQVAAVIPLHEGGFFGAGAAFSHQGWAYAHGLMARHYPGLEIVGWYVSRPGAGTAMSAGEIAAHERWFAQPHAIALIVDSTAMRGALVGRRDGQLVELHEGPIERRYTHRPRVGSPWRAYALLAVCGAGIGAGVHLLTTQLI
jgi:proteasome lid subunit RPN8/RPN11